MHLCKHTHTHTHTCKRAHTQTRTHAHTWSGDGARKAKGGRKEAGRGLPGGKEGSREAGSRALLQPGRASPQVGPGPHQTGSASSAPHQPCHRALQQTGPGTAWPEAGIPTWAAAPTSPGMRLSESQAGACVRRPLHCPTEMLSASTKEGSRSLLSQSEPLLSSP